MQLIRHAKDARQMFKQAVRRGLVTVNPFAELVTGDQSNPDRAHHVPAADAHLRRIIKLAGLEPWERTFHNLRASC